MIQVYCGDGKGKSTAAAGQALRAAANGLSVMFVQCLPDREAGELRLLDAFDNIHVLHGAENVLKAERFFAELKIKITYFSPNLIILDDAATAVDKDLLDSDFLKAFVAEYCDSAEIIITGNVPEIWMLDTADYVTDMEKIKHPYDKGAEKRKGIEY